MSRLQAGGARQRPKATDTRRTCVPGGPPLQGRARTQHPREAGARRSLPVVVGAASLRGLPLAVAQQLAQDPGQGAGWTTAGRGHNRSLTARHVASRQAMSVGQCRCEHVIGRFEWYCSFTNSVTHRNKLACRRGTAKRALHNNMCESLLTGDFEMCALPRHGSLSLPNRQRTHVPPPLLRGCAPPPPPVFLVYGQHHGRQLCCIAPTCMYAMIWLMSTAPPVGSQRPLPLPHTHAGSCTAS